MEVVDQVLVVGVRVNRFYVTVDDAELVVDCLEHRHDGVGGAGCRRNDLVIRGDFAVVDAMNDVLQLAFTRRGQYHAVNPRALQVLAQAFSVTPHPGVVHQQCVLNAVLGVIHLSRVLRVDHLNQVAVGGDGVVFFINHNGAVERTVHRVTTQQACAFDQVVVGAFTHHDGTQTQTVAATGFFDQDARQQAANATEAVQHNVCTFTGASVLLTHHLGQFFAHKLLGRTAIAVGFELDGQFAQVYRSSPELEFAHRFEQRESFVHGQFDVIGLTMASKAVSLENRND